MNNKPGDTEEKGGAFLPDFCAGGAVFTVLVFTELVAILITLAAVDTGEVLWERLLLLSIYLQWIGISSAAALCRLRRLNAALSGRTVATLAYTVLLCITALMAELAWRVAVYQNLHLILQMSHLEFMTRNLGVCAIVAALALRYFWIQHQWQRETLAAGNARFTALQARIRPHFLFNSLNSIAELSRSRPVEAETAIEDLATLLRATLDEHDQPWPLREEVSLSKAYARIESTRLGDRLRLSWAIPDELAEVTVPPLCLQPLIENAVRHGIEPLQDGGEVRVTAQRLGDDRCEISVSNPHAGSDSDGKGGAGEALENTSQRLRWLYGADKAELRIQTSDGQFSVSLIIPVSTAPGKI